MGQVTSKICFVGTAFILKIWPIRVTQHPILGEIIQQVWSIHSESIILYRRNEYSWIGIPILDLRFEISLFALSNICWTRMEWPAYYACKSRFCNRECVCEWVWVCVSVYLCSYLNVCMCVSTCVNGCVYLFLWVWMCARVRVCVCVCVNREVSHSRCLTHKMRDKKQTFAWGNGGRNKPQQNFTNLKNN